MFGIKTFFAGLFVGSVTALLAMQFHVINTNDGLIVLPRSNRPPIRSTYVDVRKWSLAMWRQHPDVAQAAIKYGRPDLLGGGMLNSIFPKQTDVQPTSTEGKEQSKFALDALVPIKFSNPNEAVTEQTISVPDPVLPYQFEPPQTSEPNKSEFDSIIGSLADTANEVLPKSLQFSPKTNDGLPKLQHPVPIIEDQTLQQSYSPPAKESTSDMFTDVLKALIPQSKQEQTSTDSTYGVSYPTFQIQAPAPGQPGASVDYQFIPKQDQQLNIPTVRPF